MYRGANMANVQEDTVEPGARGEGRGREPVEEEYVDSDVDTGSDDENTEVSEGDGDENIVKTEIKRMFRRTKRDALRMFERVRRPFDDFINRR
jgi:hypothetical protein